MPPSGVVGSWEWDPATGCFILDEGAAELMAGDVRLAGRPLRSERATAGLDAPEARRFLGEVRQAAEQEEDVAFDLWVASPTGPARRVLCRGRIHRDARHQPVCGEGTLIDADDAGAEARTLLELERAAASEAIDEAAELLIAARQAIDASGSRRLRQLVDVLLLEVAREIASRSVETQPHSH
ncbi:hypothetical protein E8E01_23260 [Methylorubrum populi]|nr:hypothetical protein E8E01_23260 [Methylorubrum populi]